MKVRIEIHGTQPLLMCNARASDPLHPIARALKSISSKSKKTDDDHLHIARLEFEAHLYFSEVLGPYIPGANIEKALVEGARVTRQGKQVERGLFVEDMEVPLIYSGPRTVEQLWADENFRSRLSAKVKTSRVMRTRPIFRDWSLDVDAEIDPGLLNIDAVQDLVTDAGSMVGLGDYRPRYGRFTAKVQPL